MRKKSYMYKRKSKIWTFFWKYERLPSVMLVEARMSMEKMYIWKGCEAKQLIVYNSVNSH